MFTEQRLREIAKDVCKGKATAEQDAYVVAFYTHIFKKPFSQCKCQLCDALFLILQNLNRMNTKYRLKKGIVLRLPGKAYRLTHNTITDELAEKHLTAQPEDVKFFDLVAEKFRPKKAAPVLPESVKEEVIEIKPEDDKAEPLPVEKYYEPAKEPEPVKKSARKRGKSRRK